MKNTGAVISLIYVALLIAFLVGEIMCIVKFFQCDFEEPYKAEIIYGISIVTGIGGVTGYMDFGEHEKSIPEYTITYPDQKSYEYK